MKFLLLFLFFCASLCAQEAAKPSGEPLQPVDRQAVALQSLAALIDQLDTEIVELNKKRRIETDSAERTRIATELDTKLKELNLLRIEFVSVAANINPGDIAGEDDEEISLKGELDALLQPVVRELKEITSAPREVEQLRTKINSLTEKKVNGEKIVDSLAARRETTTNKILRAQLQASLADWQEKTLGFSRRLEVLEHRLTELDSREISVVDSLSRIFQKFFRSRGLHLIIALTAFVLIFYLTRKGYAIFRRVSPLHRKKARSFSVRLLDLTFYSLSFILGLIAAILVLYLANDWLLLTLVILFIIGSLWVSKQALPNVFEQAKLMLNLGCVREGERVIYQGLPWLIEKIHLYTELKNPALEGGVCRLPIKDLLGLRSREYQHEPWFPSSKGDWVLLSGEIYGKVIQQTPEHIELVKLGGSRKFIPTADFLGLNPENLSKNFRVRSTFGIDYQHQPASTTEVPGILETKLKEGLSKIIGTENIKNISVQFSAAGASSLDYDVLADFSGEAASKYNMIRRTIQRISVEVCNEQGWIIPFTQITVHQADPPK